MIYWLILVGVLFIIGYYIYRESFSLSLYLVRNPDSRYLYMKDRHRALKTYKAFLNRGLDSVFCEINLFVFEIFGYQVHVEKVLDERDAVKDMELLDISNLKRLKVMKKRKSDIDGDDE